MNASRKGVMRKGGRVNMHDYEEEEDREMGKKRKGGWETGD